MSSNVFGYAPNRFALRDAYTADNAWHVLATDGSGYATVAALKAAGKVMWPNLDPGLFFQSITFRSITSASADGGVFYVAWSLGSAPTDATAEFISGSGQTFTAPGGVNNVWVRKLTATDYVQILGLA